MSNFFRVIFFALLTLEISNIEASSDKGLRCGRHLSFKPKSDEIVFHNLDNLPKSDLKVCIPIDETVGVNNGVENKLWYFREDLLMNVGHAYWHLSNPYSLSNPEDLLTIDRRGELFYYFHHNTVARYDAERISNGLPLVTPLLYEEGSVVGGYDPHLLGTPTDCLYVRRLENMTLENITHSTKVWKLLQLDIDNRNLVGKDATLYSLDNKEGIDRLGNTIWASINSVNDERYSKPGLHTQGHIIMDRLREDTGDAFGDGDVCTALSSIRTVIRDPLFFPWHRLIDDLFIRHQNLLKPNHPTEGEFPLLWPGVEIQRISVQSIIQPSPLNSLRTYFKNLTIEIPLTKDICFSNVTYEYCIKRLDHDEFTYNITIKKQSFVTSNKAFVRIFMAPRFNFNGQMLTLEKQIPNFFAMDSFVTELDGDITVVSRSSSDSNLLNNWKLENWQENPPGYGVEECGCGWPSHLLLPKGKPGAGMIFDLIVMVTDATIDVPVQDPPKQDTLCPMRHILCGKKDQKYPDLRPMGYPFDTKPFSISTPEGTQRMVASLEEYVSLIPNSKAIQVVITQDV